MESPLAVGGVAWLTGCAGTISLKMLFQIPTSDATDGTAMLGDGDHGVDYPRALLATVLMSIAMSLSLLLHAARNGCNCRSRAMCPCR